MRILNHERIIVSDTGFNVIPSERDTLPAGGHPFMSHRIPVVPIGQAQAHP